MCRSVVTGASRKFNTPSGCLLCSVRAISAPWVSPGRSDHGATTAAALGLVTGAEVGCPLASRALELE
jgi:hypothetical protein